MNHPKHQVFIKFGLLCLILLLYFAYLTYEYDLVTGGIAALITWSFFVLCTPVADAGFLLDFPLRLLFGIRMVLSEMVVWAIAIIVNVISLTYFSDFYDTTLITRLMERVLVSPYPYWGIILLSAMGTFLSIRFGDELMDVLHHKDRAFYLRHHFKQEIILFVFFLLVLFVYFDMMSALGMTIKK